MKIWFVGLAVLSFFAGLLVQPMIENPQLPHSPLSAEKAGPQDWISENDIIVTPQSVQINVPNARWAKFADTNSMDPVLDTGANAIQIQPSSPEQLQIGDIITYDNNGRKIIHRIVDIAQDGQGYVFTVKGDNNNAPDPQPVRFEQIERVLVAIIY